VFEKFSPELLLSIAGFAISVGGFVQIFFLEGAEKKKIISLATALALLCVLFGTAAFGLYQHEENVRETTRNIIYILRRDGYSSIDQLYSEIYPAVAYSTLTKAVDRLVEDGVTRHKIEELNLKNGSVIRVRVYSMN